MLLERMRARPSVARLSSRLSWRTPIRRFLGDSPLYAGIIFDVSGAIEGTLELTAVCDHEL
jgi:hypothetical protein